MSLEPDTVIFLPSGTEISVEAAIGDLDRARGALRTYHASNMDELAADLEHVEELLVLLAEVSSPVVEQQTLASEVAAELRQCGHDVMTLDLLDCLATAGFGLARFEGPNYASLAYLDLLKGPRSS